MQPVTTFAYFTSPQDWVIIGIIVLVLFGGTKIPSLPVASGKASVSSRSRSTATIPARSGCAEVRSGQRRQVSRRFPLHIIVNIMTGFLILLSIALIAIVTMQTSKSEGFGGGVQNTPGGSFRGKAGYEEMLSNYTRIIAGCWFASAFLLAILHRFTQG